MILKVPPCFTFMMTRMSISWLVDERAIFMIFKYLLFFFLDKYILDKYLVKC